jgi:hypothetical protein
MYGIFTAVFAWPLLLEPVYPSTEEDVVGLVWTATDKVVDFGLLEWQTRFLIEVSNPLI